MATSVMKIANNGDMLLRGVAPDVTSAASGHSSPPLLTGYGFRTEMRDYFDLRTTLSNAAGFYYMRYLPLVDTIMPDAPAKGLPFELGPSYFPKALAGSTVIVNWKMRSNEVSTFDKNIIAKITYYDGTVLKEVKGTIPHTRLRGDYQDNRLSVSLPTTYTSGMTFSLSIEYNGSPIMGAFTLDIQDLSVNIHIPQATAGYTYAGAMLTKDRDSFAIFEASKNWIGTNNDFSAGNITNWQITDSNIVATASRTDTNRYYIRLKKPETSTTVGYALNYIGTDKPTAINKGETWVLSFKYRIISMAHGYSPDTIPFSVVLHYVTPGNSSGIVTRKLKDGWVHAYYVVSSMYQTIANPSPIGINDLDAGAVVDFTDFKLERRMYPTELVSSNADTTNGMLKIDTTTACTTPISYNPDFSTNTYIHKTLVGKRRHITETRFTSLKMDLSESKDNNAVYAYMYKNGSNQETYQYRDKWYVSKVAGISKGVSVGKAFSLYTDPFERFLMTDFDGISHNLTYENHGYYLKTHIYCRNAMTVKQTYTVDNYAAMRVNNGAEMDMGVYSASNELTINLIKGWNLIEICYTDGDSGGALHFASGTKFCNLGASTYMTAEVPIDIVGQTIWYNEKANSCIQGIGFTEIDNDHIRSCEGVDGFKVHVPTGDLSLHHIVERQAKRPKVTDFFTKGLWAGDDIQGINAYSANVNTVQYANKLDDWVYVGSAATNLITNGDASVMDADATVPPWDKNNHLGAIFPENWSNGYNSGVDAPATGFHASWVSVYNWGNCMRFIDKNGMYGKPASWLGINTIGENDKINTKIAVGDVLTLSWYQKSDTKGRGIRAGIYHHSKSEGKMGFADSIKETISTYINDWEMFSITCTVTSDWDLTKVVRVYFYGFPFANDGITYIAKPMLTKSAYPKEFTNTTRANSNLALNLHSKLGLQWNKPWTIAYWKIPIGTHQNNLNGYSMESLGCNSNTVGKDYIWWGKNTGSNTHAGTNLSLIPSQYFNHPRLIVVRYAPGSPTGMLQMWEYDSFGGKHEYNVAKTIASANAFVTQHGYDFLLGGWDNGGSVCDAYYRDLMVLKRRLTDAETDKLFKSKFRANDDGTVAITGNIREKGYVNA